MNLTDAQATELLPLEVIDVRLGRYRLQTAQADRLMAQSLERYGQLSPIVVCLQEETYVLIDGFKRLRAARKLKGMTELSAQRMEVDEQGAKAAIYNLNRVAQKKPMEPPEVQGLDYAAIRRVLACIDYRLTVTSGPQWRGWESARSLGRDHQQATPLGHTGPLSATGPRPGSESAHAVEVS